MEEESSKFNLRNLESYCINLKSCMSNIFQNVLSFYAKKFVRSSDFQTRLVIQKKIISIVRTQKEKYKKEDMKKTLLLQRLVRSTHTEEELNMLKLYKTQVKDFVDEKQKKKLEQKLAKARSMKTLLTEVIEGKRCKEQGNTKILEMCVETNRQLPRKCALAWNILPSRAL